MSVFFKHQLYPKLQQNCPILWRFSLYLVSLSESDQPYSFSKKKIWNRKAQKKSSIKTWTNPPPTQFCADLSVEPLRNDTYQSVGVIACQDEDVNWRRVVGHADSPLGLVLQVVVLDDGGQGATQDLDQQPVFIFSGSEPKTIKIFPDCNSTVNTWWYCLNNSCKL